MLQTGLPMRCSNPEPRLARAWRTAWLAALAALACGFHAEASETTERLPARLPTDVVPVHYDMHLEPNAAALTFNGRETIDIVVQRETKSIVLNALDLEVSEATLDGGTPAAVTVDAAAQTVTLSFKEPVATGPHRLALAFSGRIGTSAAGLFALDYSTGDGRRRLLSMQLEPTDGRRVAPMWDEPASEGDVRARGRHSEGPGGVLQHAGSVEPGRRRCAARPFPDHAEDVFLPAASFGRGPRTGVAHDRRRGRGYRDAQGRRRDGEVRARRDGRDPALVQRLLRHALSAAQARHDRRPRAKLVLRRDGELGRDPLLRAAAAGGPGPLEPVRPAGRVRGDRARGCAPVVRQPRHDAAGGTTCG